MASSAYISQALIYDNDSGFESIRHQKLLLKPGTNQPYVPQVGLLTAREYSTSSKFDSTDTHGRQVILDLTEIQVKTIIPYGSNNASSLKRCIRQLLNSNGVFGGRYWGEYLLNGDTANYYLQ